MRETGLKVRMSLGAELDQWEVHRGSTMRDGCEAWVVGCDNEVERYRVSEYRKMAAVLMRSRRWSTGVVSCHGLVGLSA